MTGWLASIVGVVVVGVIIELLTQNRRMGAFVRSIYGFIVLLVIVAPLPNFFKAEWWTANADDYIDAEVVNSLGQSSKQARVKEVLRVMGYESALVTMFDNVIYVNLGVTVDAATLAELQQILGEGVVIV